MADLRDNGPIILVTGGAGYIGSLFIRDLATDPHFQGYTIRIYDNLYRQVFHGLMNLPKAGRYEFVEGDILDRFNLERAMKGVDTVVHLAALVKTPLSFDHPEWTEQINHWGTAAVVDCAIEQEVSRLLHISSASVYGPGGVFSEADHCRPIGPYAISKLKAENEVIQGKKRGLDFTILRLGTVFGNALAMRFDGVANRFVYSVGVKRPMVIHGRGDQIRPLIHIQDASIVMRLCLTEVSADGEIVNGVTMNPSVNEIAHTLKSLTSEASVRYTDQDILTELSFKVDTSKIKSWGFTPKFDLTTGLQNMLSYWQGFHYFGP